MAKKPTVTRDVDGIEVTVTNPDKVMFPEAGHTKLALVDYYIAVGDGAMRGGGHRPHQLVRYPNGAAADHFYQKRAPPSRPPWIETVILRFPSGRSAEEVVPTHPAVLAWMANLGCLELHPHPVRADDLDHPDELRIDLDPVPGVQWPQLQAVAKVVRGVLDDHQLVGWPKTSGSRGIHVLVRIERRWGFDEVRRAALALAREVARRAPDLATSAWWKEERHGVFIDYNQNAKDRTVASAYSVRPTPDARVSAPVTWDELDACDPADFTLATVPARFAEIGDRHRGIDESAGSIASLLELFERQGEGDAPWPPHYDKRAEEPSRAPPSKRRSKTAERKARHDLREIARSRSKEAALAGLERWKARHPDVLPYLEPADFLVDAMRGRYKTWTRIRIDLVKVPKELRPPEEPLDPNEDVNDWS